MGNHKNDAILTFDYEVFLGRETGTIEKSVINPTNSVLKILKGNNAKAIFFVDATWLLFLKENFPADLQKVSIQLKNIVECGSSVELHLHPQWLNAQKKGNRIIFSSDANYRLHTLRQEAISDLFKRSTELLQSITNQKIQCFRAGGWCIEPFNQLRAVFEKFNIKYDFSVAPGLLIREGKEYDFDFSNAPKIPYYRFENNIMSPDINGQFTEIPVSTYLNNPVYRLTNKILLKISKDRIFGDGIGSKEKSLSKTISQASQMSKAMLTLDKTSFILFKFLLQIHFEKSPLIVFVSHPKTMSYEAIRNLLHVTKNYNTLYAKDLNIFTQNY